MDLDVITIFHFGAADSRVKQYNNIDNVNPKTSPIRNIGIEISCLGSVILSLLE